VGINCVRLFIWYKNQKVLWNWHHQLIDNIFIMSTTDTVNYFSYLDQNLAIANGLIKNEILQWFKFSVVNFPFWYSRACSSYSNFFNRVFLITSKLLNKDSQLLIWSHHFESFMITTVTWSISTDYLCHKLPRICSVCRYDNSVLSFKTWPGTGVITRITR
jgi:hypothetical protein